jgi:hypothetical protein
MSESLHLFEGYGIEMEYMIVDRQSLQVKPICDQVLEALGGTIVNEVSLGTVNVSNELVLHVIEFKCNGPQKDWPGMAKAFHEQVTRVNRLLERWEATLLPTAMHPLMNPQNETRLWPHGQNSIYATYNRIFDCRGHGWSNLQSVHINLPFSGDDEFGRLHAAIRLVLPLLPGLAASSPIVEGRVTGKEDNRLDFYSQNQKKIASIIGHVIPERVFTERDYQEKIFAPIKRDITPHDPEGVLEEEWLNSRGAIARFERQAIEIRVLDIQESVRADFAVVSLVVSLVQSLVNETWLSYEEQRQADELELKSCFLGALDLGGQFMVRQPFLLQAFGLKEPVSLQTLWQQVARALDGEHYPLVHFRDEVQQLLSKGTLSSRIRRQLGSSPQRGAVESVYHELARCLADGRFYV